MNQIQVCFFEKDELSESVAQHIKDTLNVPIQGHKSVDAEKPFIFLNGSNDYHDRTWDFVRSVAGLDVYVHIDCHDDIALHTAPVKAIGPANFVHAVLELGKRVVFVGQRYWSHEVFFKGKPEIFRLRNNLTKYKPIDHIFFLEQPGPYLFCTTAAFEKTLPIIRDACKARNVTNIYVIDERYSTASDPKIGIFSRTELRLPPNYASFARQNPSQYPALILKWIGSSSTDLQTGNAYVSIDMDVLRGDLVRDGIPDRNCSMTTDDLARTLGDVGKRFAIVGADICGVRELHTPTLNVVTRIFEKLSECMEYGRKERSG